MELETFKARLVGIAISTVALLTHWSLQPVAADALMPIEIALGNWSPIIEEKRPGYGAVTEKITIVLRRMGYQPTYVFMPWGQAESKVASNETDSGPRTTFPYLKTASRQAMFLYSDKPVFQSCMKFFFNKDKINNPDMTRITTLNDLSRYNVGYIAESAGYQYPEILSPIITLKGKSYPGLYEVFEQLINDKALGVQVVPATQVIGEHLLIELFPDARDKIGLLDEPEVDSENGCLLPVDYYLLVSRKNPNNAEFIDSFNEEFRRLEADKETVARIENHAEERGSLLHPLVRLDSLTNRSYILADTKNGHRIYIPRGSRGILLSWSSQEDAQGPSPHVIATVRLISGPYRGFTVTLSGDYVSLEYDN